MATSGNNKSPSLITPRHLTGRPRIAVIGGGVIGLSAAWRLAEAGAKVELFDAAHPNMGGSWAAAGMLAATVESMDQSPALRRFNAWNRALWPSFVRQLEQVSGENIGYFGAGTLFMDEQGTSGGTQDTQAEAVSGQHLHALEPHLSPAYGCARLYRHDHAVDSRRLLDALKCACARRGVTQRHEQKVDQIKIDEGLVVGVQTNGEFVPFDNVLLSAGAWSRLLLDASGVPSLPITPIKGQMLCLQMDPAAPVVRHILWGKGAYLVPRLDGRLVIGATMEEVGFDVAVTTEAIAGLRLRAETVVPALKDLDVVDTWAGLRAGSPDEAPMLGNYHAKGLYIAAGHHRNGILQSPATAEALCGLIMTGTVSDDVRPFDPNRFDDRDELIR